MNKWERKQILEVIDRQRLVNNKHSWRCEKFKYVCRNCGIIKNPIEMPSCQEVLTKKILES